MEKVATKKLKVLFPFVEAGMGHIVPMKAVYDSFLQKYGDDVDVIATYFFQDLKDPDLKYVEDELIREVQMHNKSRVHGFLQFLMLRIFGTKFSMKYLMEKRYKKGFKTSLEYMKSFNADVIFNTHFSTLYYACALRRKGESNAKILTFCPDPKVGLQWDNRGDLMLVSSAAGLKNSQYSKDNITQVPFMIRPEVSEYNRGREYYRKELGIPEKNFTILLADGAYGAGKLKKTVYELLKTEQRLTILAVCGKNEELYKEFLGVTISPNIVFKPYGFTNQMLTLAASCDLFIGKAGASNLAEPTFFGAPAIVTFCATPVEKWICKHYVDMGCAIKITNVKKAVQLAEKFALYPDRMEKYVEAARHQARCDGPEVMANIIYGQLKESRN